MGFRSGVGGGGGYGGVGGGDGGFGGGDGGGDGGFGGGDGGFGGGVGGKPYCPHIFDSGFGGGVGGTPCCPHIFDSGFTSRPFFRRLNARQHSWVFGVRKRKARTLTSDQNERLACCALWLTGLLAKQPEHPIAAFACIPSSLGGFVSGGKTNCAFAGIEFGQFLNMGFQHAHRIPHRPALSQ